jgi:hypothetical protein
MATKLSEFCLNRMVVYNIISERSTVEFSFVTAATEKESADLPAMMKSEVRVSLCILPDL